LRFTVGLFVNSANVQRACNCDSEEVCCVQQYWQFMI